MKNNINDTLIHGTAADGTVRCMAAVTTQTVAEAVRRHETSPTAAAAFGRILTGTLLLGASLKEFDRLTVQIDCDGSVGGLLAESNAKGQVRGYVKNPQAETFSFNSDNKFDVRGIVGRGMMYVTRETGFEIGLYREPYRGSVELVSGEIGEDFAYYLAKSEQIPSAVLVGVLIQRAEELTPVIMAAGGLMVQMMPGADEKVIDEIENSILRSPGTTTLIHEGAKPIDLIKTALGSLDFEFLGEKNVKFACTCSFERAVSLISSIDRQELEAMLREDKGAVMNCHFCNETYRLTEKDLEEILENQK